ncbi:sigma-54 dependent transcriptional regulator [Clostridiaceae bacterium 35-E11]
MEKIKILLLDDDEKHLKIYGRILEKKGYFPLCTSSGENALEKIKTMDFSIAITDMMMPNIDGLEFIRRALEMKPDLTIFVLTGCASIKNAVEAVKKGAFEYFTKPINVDELLLGISNILKKKNKENTGGIGGNFYNPIIGKSKAIQDITKVIKKVCILDSNVCITGESGTGKELIADMIHKNSRRKRMPFVKVNCGALPENIIESEIFGHEKGSFTGAVNFKKGKFELADKGSLFLDEIGEMPKHLQVKFLRVLQERVFERVGGTKPVKTDFRLICATNRNLYEEVKNENFREDLLYRIGVVNIHLPSLRDRKEDILDLIYYYAQQIALRMKKPYIKFENGAIELLINNPWHGNIRELINFIENLTIFYEGIPYDKKRIINLLEQKGKAEVVDIQSNINLSDAKKKFEREFIKQALIANGGNITKTAKEIGIARKNLYVKLKQLEITF